MKNSHLWLPICALTLSLHTSLTFGDDVIEFDPGQFPESVARDQRGNTYATLGPTLQVVRFNRAGAPRYFDIPSNELPEGALGTLGLFVDERRNMLVTVQGCGATGCASGHGVWAITRSGRPFKLPGTGSIVFPNDVTIDNRGNVYVTDTLLGAVWVIPRKSPRFNERAFRSARVWVEDPLLLGTGFLAQFGQPFPLGANGVAYSRTNGRHGEILVANTEQASILAISIDDHGRARNIQTVAGGLCDGAPLGLCNPLLLTVDNIDADRYGDVFAVTVAALGDSGPVPISSLYHIKRRTGAVQLVHTGAPLNLATDVSVGKTFDGAKDVWVANPGLAAGLFMMEPEPSIARLPLENSWFEAPSQ